MEATKKELPIYAFNLCASVSVHDQKVGRGYWFCSPILSAAMALACGFFSCVIVCGAGKFGGTCGLYGKTLSRMAVTNLPRRGVEQIKEHVKLRIRIFFA